MLFWYCIRGATGTYTCTPQYPFGKMSSWFIYIAEHCHRAGKSLNATEKKIGCTKDVEALQREFDSVASPIFCSIMAAWKTESDDQGEKILSALRHILSDSHLNDTPGWFDDSSGTLCDRLSGFMNCFGYALVSTINRDDLDESYLDDDDDGDGASDRLESPLRTTSASTSIVKQREDLLVGEVFSYTYKGMKNTVMVDGPGMYRSLTEGRTYTSGSKAINSYFRNLYPDNKNININWQSKPKNAANLSPKEVITARVSAATA